MLGQTTEHSNLEIILSYLQNIEDQDQLESRKIARTLGRYSEGELGIMLKFLEQESNNQMDQKERTGKQNLQLLRAAINHSIAGEDMQDHSSVNPRSEVLRVEAGKSDRMGTNQMQNSQRDLKTNNYQFFFSPIREARADNSNVSIENSQFKNDKFNALTNKLKKDLKIGNNTDDFVPFVEGQSVYVDKSLLIKDIIENENHIFISAPQRWGKSLNLSMLKAFFQPDGGEPARYTGGAIASGKYDFDGVNKNLKYFKKRHIYFENTEIFETYEDGEQGKKQVNIVEHFQGKRPVIYLNFKGITKPTKSTEQKKPEKAEEDNNWLETGLRMAVKDAYREHSYLYYSKLFREYASNPGTKTENLERLNMLLNQSNDLGEKIGILENWLPDQKRSEDLKRLGAYYNGKTNAEAGLSDSIKFLAELLHQHYGRKIMVLVDEFDKPVISIIPDTIEKLSNLETAKHAREVFIAVAQTTTNIISPLVKGINVFQCQVILTGIFNTLNKEISSGANPIHEIAITQGDDKITGHFGFNETDIDYVLSKVLKEDIDDGLKKELKAKLKYWYNGQLVGNTEMYTPSSVMRYLSDLNGCKGDGSVIKFKNYWDQSQTAKLLTPIIDAIDKNHIDMVDYLTSLKEIAEGKAVHLNHDSGKSLVGLIEEFESNSERLKTIFTNLLIRSGYLTKKNSKNEYGYPAREIEKMFIETVIKKWIEKRFPGLDCEALVQEYAESIENKDNYEKFIKEKLLDKLGTGKKTEADFQGLVGGIAMMSQIRSFNKHNIFAEVHSGDGRIDHLFLPIHGQSESVIIHEYKILRETDATKIESALSKAMDQIIQNNYVTKPLDLIKYHSKEYEHIKKFILRPILFYQNETHANWNLKMDEKTLSLQEVQQKNLIIPHHNLKQMEGNNWKIGVTKDINEQIKIAINSVFSHSITSKNGLVDLIIQDYADHKSQYKSPEEIQDRLNELKSKNPKLFAGVGAKTIEKIAKSILAITKSGGIGLSDEGLSDEEVRDKLLEYSDELRRREGISLQIEIANIPEALQAINRWHFNNMNHGFISMVKLHDEREEGAHAVLVYARRNDFDRNAGVVFQIVDPFDQMTGGNYFYQDRKRLLDSLKNGHELFGHLFGEIKTEVSIKYLDKQSIDESNCVQLCLDEIKKEVMHSRLQEIANCINNTTVLMPVEEICNNDTLGRIQDTLISFHRSRELKNRIILPLFNDNKWHVMVLDLQRSKAIIDVLHYSTIALPNHLRRALSEMLNTALEGAIFFKPLQRIMGPNGPVTPPRINIPNYDIKIRDEYNSTITDTKKLTDQIYHAITGRYMWPNQTNPGRSSTNDPASKPSLLWGKQDNLRIANTSEPRMDIESKCEVPAKSIFGTTSTNIFGSNPNSSSRFPNQSNESLVKSGIQEQRGFFGNSWARPQLSSESKFFKN